MITVFDRRTDDDLIKEIWEKMENMEEKTRNVKYIQSKSMQDMWTMLPIILVLITMYLGGNQNMVAIGYVLLLLFTIFALPSRKQCSFEIYVIEEIRKKNK